MLTRKPHVAGSFYPSEPSELANYCQSRLVPSSSEMRARAVILPHAGYIYSGEVACGVLSRVKVPEKNLLIGPDHRGYGSDFSLFGEGEWQTPLGNVPIEKPLARAVLEISRDIEKNEEAHRFEHSLEVLVPFLQTKNQNLKIVPVIAGTLNFQLAREVAILIAEMLVTKKEDILVVISNDMSHYAEDSATRKKDRYALDAIENLDAAALLKAIREHDITMCGMVPVYMLLAMHEKLGVQKASLVDYRTSAEVTQDRQRVVGYAGFIFE